MQGDLGFLFYKNKKYGQFWVAVNTYTKSIFAIPIANTKAETLIKAVDKMLKVHFY